MKRQLIYAAAALILAGCAKESESLTPTLEKQAFDAWVETHKADSWTQTKLGSWIIESTEGDSSQPLGSYESAPFVRLEYTITNLKGTISSSSREDVAIQLGTWSNLDWYGPVVSYRAYSIYAGLDEILNDMNIGGTCRFAVPGWLLSTETYSTGEQYNKNVTGNSSAIYDIKVVEAFDDITEWETQVIRDLVGGDEEMAKLDTLEEGIYYKCIKPSDNPDTTYSDGASLYVNYVCRRALDYQAVDSNIEDTCRVIRTYVKGNTYEPILVNYDEDYTSMTMTDESSDMIDGFARAIQAMGPHEKGIVYMISAYGYSSTGSDNQIPAYCPLVFELEMTDAPE